MTETCNECIAFGCNAPLLLKIFRTICIEECGKEFGSSGRHCQSLSWRSVVWFFRGFPTQTCWGCVCFSDQLSKSKSHKTAAFGLSAFFLPGSQRWCHFTGGLSWGACGNRKQSMLQPFPSCQPTCHDRISDAEFGVSPFDWISVSLGNLKRLKRLLRRVSKAYSIISYPCKVQTVLEELTFQVCASQGRQSGGRRMPGSQTVVFSFHGKHVNLRCYLLSNHWLIILFVPFLLPKCCAMHLYLALW